MLISIEKLYNNNINALKNRREDILKKIEKINTSSYEIVETKIRDNFTLFDKEKNIYLHSKYDPFKEAKTIVDRFITQKYDIIFIGGFGCGYIPLYLIREKSNFFSKLIVIEKDKCIFKMALKCTDLRELFENEKFDILFEENGDVEGLNDILINNLTKNIYTLLHIPSLKIYPDFYKNLNNLIDSYLSRKSINIATLTRFQHLWLKNIFKNKEKFLTHKGIKELYNGFKGFPILIISAGPSLADYIDIIKKEQNKFIIVAVDTVFQVLIKNSIYPDFVITVDPQFINYKYFEYNKYYNSILVSEPSTFPLILDKYKGRILFFSSVFPFVKFLEEFTTFKGEIDMGGSVSTTAFDFAYRLGGNPLILVGQDLAFLHNRSHTKGAYVEKYWALRYSKYNTSLNGEYKYIHNNLFIKIKSNNGKLVETDKRLMIFWVWFNNKLKNLKEVKVYNTSLGGAYLNNTIVKSLSDIISENYFTELDKSKIISNIKDIIEDNKIKNNIKKLNEMKKDILNELGYLEKKSKEGIKLSKRLYELIEKRLKSNEINIILSKLDKIDKELNQKKYITRFLSSAIQDVIYTVLEEYENFLTEKEKNDNDLKIARRSILLYEGILKSIVLYKKLYEYY